MSGLAVSFSGSVLSPNWIQVSFILIDGVCLGLGEFYGLSKNLLGAAFNVFQENPNEFVIPKSVLHLGERFLREA